MKQTLKKIGLSMTVLILFLSSLTLAPIDARAAPISLPKSSVDKTVPLEVSPYTGSLPKTLYYDGLTRIINEVTGEVIGGAYRYKGGSTTVTMINPGSIGDWAEAKLSLFHC